MGENLPSAHNELPPGDVRGKTLFLVVHNGFMARYLLRTDIFKVLQDSGLRIVILTPNPEEAYFRREFEAHNVAVEPLRVDDCMRYWRHSRVQRLLHVIRKHSLNRRGPLSIRTVEGYFDIFQQAVGAQTLQKKLFMRALKAFVWAVQRSQWIRSTLIKLESRLFVGHFHEDLFEQYRPDAVVTTSLGYFMPDNFVMREARQYGAKVVSVILSWDNPSSRGMAGALADRVIAWTDIMKRELIQYHDIPAERIDVGGVAGFDLHFRNDVLWDRDHLFGRYGFDLDKRLLFFATKSPNQYPWNLEIANLVAWAIQNGEVVEPCQLLVRLHPNFFQMVNGNSPYWSEMEEQCRELSERYSFIRFSRPEILSDTLSRDMSNSEFVELASILRWSDVVINMFSTVAIEASIFDVPVVHVCFEGDPTRRQKGRHSIQFDRVQDHNQRLIQTGSVRVAFNADELVNLVNQYLKQRSLDREARMAIKKRECGPYPGRAGVEIGRLILESLTSSSSDSGHSFEASNR